MRQFALWALAVLGAGAAVAAPAAADADPVTVAQVKDLVPGATGGSPGEQTAVGGTLFFTAYDGSFTPQLWKSDGTGAGTKVVKEPISAAELTNVGGTLFFAGGDGSGGEELWKSDGTAAGTVRVKNINPGGSSSPRDLTAVGSTLFFTADDGSHGRELWKSDGSMAGTKLVKDIDPVVDSTFGPLDSDIVDPVAAGGLLFFGADDGSHGHELWKSDGTTGGTSMVADITPDAGSGFFDSTGSVHGMAAIGGSVLFAGRDETHGVELWKSNGVGASMVKDINTIADPGTTPDGTPDGVPVALSTVGSEVFFWAEGDGVGAHELWKSDGSGAGTVRVSDTPPAGGFSLFTDLGGTAFFIDDDGSHGRELWKSDGTPAGTGMVKDVNPSAGSSPGILGTAGGLLFFSADDGTHGDELWQTDGTADGTTLAADIRSDAGAGSSPASAAAVGNTLFFSADDGSTGRELWKATVPGGADTTPPQTTITSGPANGAVISDPSPSFAFAANETASFQCSVDGAAFSACASPKQIGPLADGAHSFRVRAIDAALNVDPTPAARSFTVETGPSAACLRAKHQLKRAKQKLKKAKKKLKKSKKHGSHRKVKKAKKKVKKAKKAVKKAKKRKRRKC